MVCCSITAAVFPCLLKRCWGGRGRRAPSMLARFEGYDLIINSMFLRLKYPAHSFLAGEWFVRCVWSELPNRGMMVAPSGRHSYRTGQHHCSYDEIQLQYLFLPPPVAWFHLRVHMLLSIFDFLWCSIQHMFPECRLLDEKLNAVNRIAVEETCLIIVVMVVCIGQTIVSQDPSFPRVDVYCVGHFVQPFEWGVGRSEVADGCHRRVAEQLVNSSSAQARHNALVR